MLIYIFLESNVRIIQVLKNSVIILDHGLEEFTRLPCESTSMAVERILPCGKKALLVLEEDNIFASTLGLEETTNFETGKPVYTISPETASEFASNCLMTVVASIRPASVGIPQLV